MSAYPWTPLGITATDDPALIRRAYADRLRAIDPDADPAAFADLRAARDEALWLARDPQDDADDDGDEADEGLWKNEPQVVDAPGETRTVAVTADADTRGDHRASGDPPPTGPVRASPWAVPPIDYDEHYRAVHALLLDGSGEPLDQAASLALSRRLLVLFHDPRLEEIDFRDRAERWFAELVVDAGARADPVVSRIVDRFGWHADRGRIDQPWRMAAAVQRSDDLRLLADLQRPDHPHHAAWRELTRPAGRRRFNPFIDRGKVRALLAAVRARHPDLEAWMEPGRVARWEPGGARRVFGGIDAVGYLTWFVLAALIFAVRTCPVGQTPLAPPVIAPSLPAYEQAIAPALAAVAGPGATQAVVAGRNPKLDALLRANWSIAREAGDAPPAFQSSMRTLLYARLTAGLREADHSALSAFRRVQLAEAKAARDRDVDICDRLFRDTDKPLPDWLIDRFAPDRARAAAPVLLAYAGDPSPRAGPTRFTISGPVVVEAARRANLSPDRLGDALLDRGTPAARCAARIALIETALDLPRKEGLKLLRSL